jgi:cytoskeletal protein RodZ
MKRVFLFLLIVGLPAMLAFSQKRETRSVPGFTGIDASSVFDITVTTGNTESLLIEADDNVMPYVRSEVKNGVLHLYLDNSNNLKNIKVLKASVVMKKLDKVTLSGACKLTANDFFTSEKFKADCSGASNMTVNMKTGQLTIEISGACNIRIKANVTGDTYLNAAGASSIKGELIANNVTINSSGDCLIELTGSTADIKMDVSGVAKVNTGDFTAKAANINSSGISKVTINVTDALKVNSSGMSSVNYKGSPTLDISGSKFSKVKKID